MAIYGNMFGYTEEPLASVVYWYDRNIKLYTFQYLDALHNQTKECDYCSKFTLKVTKKSIVDETGIKPIMVIK